LARGFAEAALRDGRGHPRPAHAAELGGGRVDLSDEEAYRIFQRVCANGFSDELRLYKLYARAYDAAALLAGLAEREFK
jgi:hypothetical protein